MYLNSRTDSLKTARYTPLRDRLAMLLPVWEVGIQTYTMGIRGSHDPDRWHANLTRLGLPPSRREALVRNLTLQALTDLSNLYSIRYAALHHLQHAQYNHQLQSGRQSCRLHRPGLADNTGSTRSGGPTGSAYLFFFLLHLNPA
jgi:hypothetical protein